MPTEKRRLNLSLTKEVELALAKVARRDHMPESTKALELLRSALEVDEDEIWNALAKKRDTLKAKFVSPKKAWV